MDCLAADREIKRKEMELNSYSWMGCLAVNRTQERSRAGRWNWSLTAGWIVLLLTEPRRDQEQGERDELS